MNLKTLFATLAIAHYPCLLISPSFPLYTLHHCNWTSLTWNALLQSSVSGREISLHVCVFLWCAHPTQSSSVFGIFFFFNYTPRKGVIFPQKCSRGSVEQLPTGNSQLQLQLAQAVHPVKAVMVPCGSHRSESGCFGETVFPSGDHVLSFPLCSSLLRSQLLAVTIPFLPPWRSRLVTTGCTFSLSDPDTLQTNG